jgi:pimeloyl-ACP methyl ester carboxylesterase
MIRSAWAVLSAVSLVLALSPPATSEVGPRLTVDPAQVLSALHCTGDLRRSPHPPVLFLHATAVDSHHNWSWNWDRALDRLGWAHCDLDTPESGNADIQVAGEYVAYAIRHMSRAARGPISMVGHSQGGMVGRWALAWWPDTRRMVEDYVALAAPNHGTLTLAHCPIVRDCTPADWQQGPDSTFLRALNAIGETWPEIDYTAIATEHDELVVPYTSTHLAGDPSHVTNTTVQQACPEDQSEHFLMAVSTGAWLLGLDALTHPGPADVTRVEASACAEPVMPGVDRTTFATDLAAAAAMAMTSPSATGTQSQEPPLEPYAQP